MKKNKFKLFVGMRSIATQIRRICAITLVAVISFLYISCDDGNKKEPEKKTPTADDFIISGLGPYIYDGTEKEATIETKNEYIGRVYISYNGKIDKPISAGSYTVTFDVFTNYDSNWNTVYKLPAGTLVINPTNSATVASLTTTIAVSGSDVYVLSGEYSINSYGTYYWKNGEKINVPDNGRAYAISVLGNDVYLSGSYNNGTEHIACYWKNGIKTNLLEPTTAVYPSLIADASSVAIDIVVSGADVYVAGYYVTMSNDRITRIICYWKNGEKTDLLTSYAQVDVYGIFVSGSDAYIAGGSLSSFYYWKNDTRINPYLQSAYAYVVNAFTVSGSDVYFAGYDINENNNRTACYWRNGSRINHTAIPNIHNPSVIAIFVSGSDVYTAGMGSYWKNTTRTILSGSVSDITVSGSDVYVSGHEFNGSFHVACYWKNGVKVDLGVE